MTGALARYPRFFDLFGDFRGYVEFFLFHDLVTETASEVRFFTPFDDFASSPLPQSVDSYVRFRAKTVAFVRGRNERIADYARSIP